MIPTFLTELFLNVKTFSVPLAEKIGIENSFVFTYLLYKYSDCEFVFEDTFSSKFGIRDIKKCIRELKDYKLLSEKNGKIKLLVDEIDFLFNGIVTITLDHAYEQLIKQYIEMCRKKGRVFTRSKVIKMLEGYSEEQAKTALRYSIQKEFITLYKNENNNGNSFVPRGRIDESLQGEIKNRKTRGDKL